VHVAPPREFVGKRKRAASQSRSGAMRNPLCAPITALTCLDAPQVRDDPAQDVDPSSGTAFCVRRSRSLSHPRRCTVSEPDCSGADGTDGSERSPVGGGQRTSALGRIYSAPFRADAATTPHIRVTDDPLCICFGTTYAPGFSTPGTPDGYPKGDRRATEQSGTSQVARRVEAACGFSAAGWRAKVRWKSYRDAQAGGRGEV
jgi:hypothetical protein